MRPAADSPDAMMLRVGDIEAAVRPERGVLGAGQQRGGGRAAIADVAGVAYPRDGSDDAVGRDTANPLMELIGDVEAAVRPKPEPVGRVELGAGRRAAVAQLRAAA